MKHSNYVSAQLCTKFDRKKNKLNENKTENMHKAGLNCCALFNNGIFTQLSHIIDCNCRLLTKIHFVSIQSENLQNAFPRCCDYIL